MDRRLATALAAWFVVACQSAPSAPARAAEPVALYQYAGSRQCERGGKSLEALRKELAAAGVTVAAASCGQDGRVYASVCGGPDGRILVVRVPPGQAALASGLGLKPLRELPEAVFLPCR